MPTATAKKPDLSVITGGKPSFRTVEVVKRAESDRWDIVEAIQADVDASGLTAHAVRDDTAHKGQEFNDLCSNIADACRAEGADSWKARTVSNLYRVAVAWPRESRIEGATYGAHERLFHREDRVNRLTKLVERSSDGKVNRNDVDLWLSTLKPASVRGFLDGIDHAVRAAVFNKGKPWTHVAQDDRDEIARRLRAVAEEVQHSEGKFGR